MALLEGHSTVLYGDELYVFGGKDNKTGQLLNTVWKVSVPASQVAATQFSQAHLAANGENASFNSTTNAVNALASSGGTKASELTALGSGAVAAVVATTGPVPTPRCYHAVALRPPFMLVWGGTTLHPATVMNHRGERVSEDRCAECVIFALHLETREWAVHVLSGRDTRCPRPRCHAVMAATAHSVLMYGGYPNVTDEDTGAAHVEPNHWSVFEVGADAVLRSNARAGSEVPMLWGHTALFAHGCLCVFGGVDFATMTETNALCLFSLEEKRWRWAEFALAPEARALHTAVLHGSNMFVYGGFTGRPDRTDHPTFNDVWRFSLNTGLWDECACTGVHPPARSGHTATIVQHNMFVIGGLEGNRENLAAQCTLAILDLHTFHWNMCPIYFPVGGINKNAGDEAMYDRSTGDTYSLGNNNNNNTSNPGSPSKFGSAFTFGGNGNNNNNSLLRSQSELSNSPEKIGYVPPNMRRNNTNVTLSIAGSGNNNVSQQPLSPTSNNNNNSLGKFGLAGTTPGRGSLHRNGANTPTSSRLLSQQEKDLMEAAAPVGFGNLTNNSKNGGAGGGGLNQILQNVRQQNNNSNGGIPSATNNSRSSSTMLNLGGGPNILSSSNQFPGSALASQFGSIPKSVNNNNNNNANNSMNPPKSNNNNFSMFADQIQQQRNNNNSGNVPFSAQNYPIPSYLSPQGNNNNSNNNNSGGGILGGMYSQNFLNNSPPQSSSQQPRKTFYDDNSPPRSQEHSPRTGSPNTANEQYNYNNSNIGGGNNFPTNQPRQQQQDQFRSPSNALLSNVNRFDQTSHNQMMSEKDKQMKLAQQMHRDANQQITNTQNQYAKQGVHDAITSEQDGGDGGFDWAVNDSRATSTANQNMYQGGRSGNGNERDGSMNGDRSQMRNPGEGRLGSPALTNVWNTDPDQLPGRRPYEPNISFVTGAFQAPAHSLKERANELAQQQAIQQHINETQQFLAQQQQNGFGVRPVGGLGRSNSVGLGMPPAMIDTMNMQQQQQNANSIFNNNNFQTPNNNQRQSPSRSSSSTSFGRRNMMRT